MPRSSPYVIVLTPKEQSVLEARTRRYTLPYRDVIRARIVLLAAGDSRTRRSESASTCPGLS